MEPSKIFKINDLVDLRLIGNRTHIYINNKRFLKCTRLVLNIPRERIQEADEIKSIDEAKEVFKTTVGSYPNLISPEEEFKGHCSNIQAFFENGLSTVILASNLAFPLLKKLVDLRYEPAMRVFKEEIVTRFNEGTHNSRMYLYKQGYLNYLNEEERQVTFQEYTCEKCNSIFHGDYFQMKKVRFKLCPICLNTFSVEERDNFERKKEIEWLKREFGENHKLSEALQEKLKEWKELELFYIAQRQKKKEAERRYVYKYNPNYLNDSMREPNDKIPFLERIAEWIAGKIALRKVGRKSKKRKKNR